VKTAENHLENHGNSPLYKLHGPPHSPAPMHLAAIDWLSISINLLLVVFFIVCLLMTLLILMQRPKQEGLGAAFGGGVTDQVFGARTTNVLQRGTVYLGSLFFLISLTLAVLIGHQNKKTSIISPETPAAETAAAETTAAEPSAPPAEALPKSLLEELPVTETTPAEGSVPVEQPAAADESVPTQEAAPADETPAVEPAAPAEDAVTPEENSGQP
jgi:preprotein translocase subunit SecG